VVVGLWILTATVTVFPIAMMDDRLTSSKWPQVLVAVDKLIQTVILMEHQTVMMVVLLISSRSHQVCVVVGLWILTVTMTVFLTAMMAAPLIFSK
jgi:hypothetical protein